MPQIYTILNSGQKMPLLGLGVYDMYNSEAEGAISTALEIGYRLIDTASMYANEKEVGNAVRNSGISREEIFVTTKVNNPDQGYDNTLRAFEQSFRKLDIGHIDLYLVHWPIKATRKETWKALEYLYETKQVRSIGVANYLLPFLNELKGYAALTPVVNQVEFSPWLYLKDLLTYCRQHNIQLQSYTPLVKGTKLRDEALLKLAKKYNKTAAQMILRWNLQHGVSTIPKSANAMRLKENFDVFDFEISGNDMMAMDAFNYHHRVQNNPMKHL